MPPPLIEQLEAQARLIAPVIDGTRQRLTLLEKTVEGTRGAVIAKVLTCRRRDATASAAID